MAGNSTLRDRVLGDWSCVEAPRAGPHQELESGEWEYAVTKATEKLRWKV